MARLTEMRAVRRAPELGDAVLCSRLASGDLSALGELYERHASAVRAFAGRLAGAREADDIAHDAFLALARSAARYDGRAEVRAYLFGIAAMLARGRARSLARWLRTLGRVRHAATPAPSPEEHAASTEELRRFEGALERLDVGKRAVLLMAEVEGLSGEQIAAALGIPVATVWTRLHYARADLRRALGRGAEP
jgi:RNA polymerase sigma-70 factor (ECF subfamily)